MNFRLLFVLLITTCSGFGYGTNLVPNSSFEVGHGRGWIQLRTANNNALGNINFCTEQITNNTAFHGGSSMMLWAGAFCSSRLFWALGGNYTLSWYEKSVDGGTYGLTTGFVTAQTNIDAFVLIGNQALTGSWVRSTTNVTLAHDGYWSVHFYTPALMYLDAVQFETGSVATAYSPSSEIECGIRLTGMYGMHFTGNTPNFDLVFRNEGAVTNARAEYRLYDVWNSNYLTHSFSITIPAATNITTNVTLPRKGHVRVMSRLYDVADSYDECKTIAYNFPSNTVGNVTNDWLGGHAHVTRFHALREVYAGRRVSRSLSPAHRNTRWWTDGVAAIEDTRGSLVYDPAHSFTNWQQTGLLGLGCLTPADTKWPTWATNTTATTNANFPYVGMWDGVAWSNYCYWTTLTNKGAGGIDFVEIGPNEPFQTGPDSGPPHPDDNPIEDLWIGADNLPINTPNPTNYAKILSNGVNGVMAADPTMKIIAIAGASGEGTWGWMVWTNLHPSVQSNVYAISYHRQQDDHNLDPNDPYYLGITTSYNNPIGWRDRFQGVRPRWNSECFNAGPTYMRGLNGLFNYDLVTAFTPESIRSEEENRQLSTTIAALQMALRDIGCGGQKFFYYSTRYFNETHMHAGPNSAGDLIADQNQVDKPEGVALSTARHMVDAPGYGPITNNNMGTPIPIEMYMFTNATRGWSVAVAWSADRLNRMMVLSNSVGIVDLMGNDGPTNVSTIRLSRTPIYVISSTLSGPVLSNTLKFATATNTSDVIAPRVSIDIAPTGEWSGNTNKQLFKWTALDDTAVAWRETATASHVLSKWKLNGGTYTDYSQSNHVWVSQIPAGTNVFWVKAKDITGNEGEYSYNFSGTDVPSSPDQGGPGGGANTINVGTLNIGTITVIPP